MKKKSCPSSVENHKKLNDIIDYSDQEVIEDINQKVSLVEHNLISLRSAMHIYRIVKCPRQRL